MALFCRIFHFGTKTYDFIGLKKRKFTLSVWSFQIDLELFQEFWYILQFKIEIWVFCSKIDTVAWKCLGENFFLLNFNGYEVFLGFSISWKIWKRKMKNKKEMEKKKKKNNFNRNNFEN